MQHLRCRRYEEQSFAVLRLDGVLDLTTVAVVRSAFLKCVADEPRAVLVDLAGVSIGDGLAAAVFSSLARSVAEWPGIESILFGASDQVAAELRGKAVLRRLPLYRTRREALERAAELRPPERASTRLLPMPDACVAARRLVVTACREWGLDGLAEHARVVMTELVSNAVRHAATELIVTVTRGERFMHLSVRDGAPAPPRLTGPESRYAPGGRGLLVVDALSASWGWRPYPDGKIVWATLRIDGVASGRAGAHRTSVS